jgi:hypothetical protein
MRNAAWLRGVSVAKVCSALSLKHYTILFFSPFRVKFSKNRVSALERKNV